MDYRPKTAEQYVELVDQALFEIDDLRMSAEYDMDSLGMAMEFLDALESGVRKLRDSMADGSYRFEDEDLPFMKVVERENDRTLPFKHLLRLINATHKMGLAVDDE